MLIDAVTNDNIAQARAAICAGVSQTELDQALAKAAWLGSRPLVALLLEHGASSNPTPECAWSALFAAIEQYDVDLVRFLLANGADPNCWTSDGCSPLHSSVDIEGDAARQGRREPS